MYYKGKYKLKNPSKYKGNTAKIQYRSSWELKFMIYCDTKDVVERWSSEKIRIPYISSINNNKRRNYIVDFWIKLKSGNEYLIEIKPKKQTTEPKPPKVKSQKALHNYLYSKFMFENNIDKWTAAERFAKENKMTFVIATEDVLANWGIKIYG
jgi:hypothetical protein